MSKRYQAAILTASYNGLQVPNAPTIGTATAGAGSASVTFTAPSNVGGGAITGYTVISSPGSITGTGTSSPITVSGLTNGTAYTFTVVATNAYGSGPASAASNSVTPSLNYIEDVFSTYLYTGNGSAQTITNGIDLSGQGGLVWLKTRNVANAHYLLDTVRGNNSQVSSNSDQPAETLLDVMSAFTSSGFSLGASSFTNGTDETQTSWTFRKQPKFFDVVTYTGDGSLRTISHNLGSVPACIIIKSTSEVSDWAVYHRSLGNTGLIKLNTTAASTTNIDVWNSTTPTSTVFSLGGEDIANMYGKTFVAYLFAHDAGGFGLTGTDNVISCGSYTGDGTTNWSKNITLGYEPQWVLVKRTSTTGNWFLVDTMRGMPVNANSEYLRPNLSNAEANGAVASLTATGFTVANTNTNNSGATFIYIAIRRGPMAVPTTGTSVFSPQIYAGDGTSPRNLTSGFTTDLVIGGGLAGSGANIVEDRLRGNAFNQTFDSAAETTGASASSFATNNGYILLNTGGSGWNASGTDYDRWMFKRAPSFFDEVCYTGTGANRTVTHNLTVTPELMIVKDRSATADWRVYNTAGGSLNSLYLNGTPAYDNDSTVWNNTSPTASVFTVGTNSNVNASGNNYVAYLFATCAGVSKVGSYTGTGALQTINCGFTGGARFVLIKRTDSTGDWYTYDSAAGISSGNDPYMRLNSGGAQVTGTNYVDTDSTGFKVTAAAPAAINASGGTFIFLAIA